MTTGFPNAARNRLLGIGHAHDQRLHQLDPAPGRRRWRPPDDSPCTWPGCPHLVSTRDTVSLRAFAQAAAAWPWVPRERRVLPTQVDARMRVLEEAQRRSSAARRYVG
ncbi:hypothetical protein CJD44_12345 [Streptomyces sp. alain-838]|nr:hypothetical protein CJD44_12345 [Streptomyces sp. alain-838]